jgi:hypothetical protein
MMAARQLNSTVRQPGSARKANHADCQAIVMAGVPISIIGQYHEGTHAKEETNDQDSIKRKKKS